MGRVWGFLSRTLIPRLSETYNNSGEKKRKKAQASKVFGDLGIKLDLDLPVSNSFPRFQICPFRQVARPVPHNLFLKAQGLKWVAVSLPFFCCCHCLFFSRTNILPSMWFDEAARKGKGEKYCLTVPQKGKMKQIMPWHCELPIKQSGSAMEFLVRGKAHQVEIQLDTLWPPPPSSRSGFLLSSHDIFVLRVLTPLLWYQLNTFCNYSFNPFILLRPHWEKESWTMYARRFGVNS